MRIPLRLRTDNARTVAPTLLLVGPYMGNCPTRGVSAGRALADRLSAEGYSVRVAPTGGGRVGRACQVALAMLPIHSRCDVLVLQVYSGLSFLLADLVSRVAGAYRMKIVAHVHGGAIPSLVRSNPKRVRTVLERAAAVVVPSAYLARALASVGSKPVIVPNALDLQSYWFRQRRTPKPRLLWMRAFHQVYNPEMALLALVRLRRFFPDASLVMAGPDMGMLATAKARAELLGLKEVVVFPGCLGGERKLAVLVGADIFLNTASIDNTPVSVLEAMASGLCVVSTNVGGIPDLLAHEKDALLVPADSPSAMAEAAKRILIEPGLAERLSLDARCKAEGFDWRAVRPQWDALFSEVHAHA